MNLLKVHLFIAHTLALCVSQLIFLDNTCKKNCTLKKNLPCKIELHKYCPTDMNVHTELWPGKPDNVNTKTAYTFSPKTNRCEVEYKLDWIAPDDDSGKKVTGFVIRIMSLSGSSVGKEECAVFNMAGANWTDQDIRTKLPFSFNCFKNLNQGRFAIDLYSLPTPDLTGLPKGFKKTVKFEQAFYDKAQKKCTPQLPVIRTNPSTTPVVVTESIVVTENKPESHISRHLPISGTTVTMVQQTDSSGNKRAIQNPMIVVPIIGGIILIILSIIVIVISVLKRRHRQGGYRRLYTDEVDSDSFENESHLNNGIPADDPDTLLPAGESVSRVYARPRNLDRNTEVTVETVDCDYV